MKILVVDDDKFIVDMVSDFLERDGIEVEKAYNGQEGIDLCSLHTFDMVIVDIFMPVKNGFELMMEVKQKYPDMIFIVMSGLGAEGSANYNEAISCGAKLVLEKPFSYKTLVTTIRDVGH